MGEKKPGRASKSLGFLTDGADIGTCKISAQLVLWLLRNGHQKTVTTQLDLLRLNWIDCSFPPLTGDTPHRSMMRDNITRVYDLWLLPSER